MRPRRNLRFPSDSARYVFGFPLAEFLRPKCLNNNARFGGSVREMIRTLVLSTMISVLPLLAQAQAPGQTEEKYIVTFRPGTPPALRAAAVARFGGAVRHNFSI